MARNLIYCSSSHIRVPSASPAGGQGGNAPPIFFLLPPRNFFGRKKLMFFGGKNVKIYDFGQKKPSRPFFFFWTSPVFFGQKKPSDFGEDIFFFGDHLYLGGKCVISARKSLRISAKTFFFFGDHQYLAENV